MRPHLLYWRISRSWSRSLDICPGWNTIGAFQYIVQRIVQQPRHWWRSSSTTGSLQVGFAYSYSIGIIFAISVCASTSGGHVSLAVSPSGFSKCFLYLRPWGETWNNLSNLGQERRLMLTFYADTFLHKPLAPTPICIFVYYQWKELIDESEALLVAAGLAATTMFQYRQC